MSPTLKSVSFDDILPCTDYLVRISHEYFIASFDEGAGRLSHSCGGSHTMWDCYTLQTLVAKGLLEGVWEIGQLERDREESSHGPHPA